MRHRPLFLAVAALAVAACAARVKLPGNVQVMRGDIEEAKRAGAIRCAPGEIATAEANLDFADAEVAAGKADRAKEHLHAADRNLKDALQLSGPCAPKKVVVARKPQTSIEKTDKDNDGVPDVDDVCPEVPGRLELGGCPDTDGDGVADRVDKCPNQFGVPPDGCPKKYSLVVVKRDNIVIRQQVRFATAKSRVLSASFHLLDQVVQVLNDYPKMRVSIEGHTDNAGRERVNMRLSQKRAEAVRNYLVSKGISASRLTAIGYGPTKPLAPNRTAKGKAKNRRTEFKVVALE